MRMRLTILAMVLLGCDVAAAGEVPLPRPRPHMPVWNEPRSFAEAVAGLNIDFTRATAEPTACDRELAAIAVTQPMPWSIGPGACGGRDIVELEAVLDRDGTPIALKPPPILRCEMAEAFASWVRDDAVTRFAAAGDKLHEIETFDDYDCRGRNRVAGAKLSEHGKANALDVRGFALDDGRLIEPTDAHADRELRLSLRDSACARFSTVLGPGSDGYHEQHVHFDLAERAHGYRICEWNVFEPPPEIPLPRPRPTIVASDKDLH